MPNIARVDYVDELVHVVCGTQNGKVLLLVLLNGVISGAELRAGAQIDERVSCQRIRIRSTANSIIATVNYIWPGGQHTNLPPATTHFHRKHFDVDQISDNENMLSANKQMQ